MARQVARSMGSLVLSMALAALLGLPLVAVIYAQLECYEYKCVEVRYQAKDPPNDLRNVFCVHDSTPGEVKEGWAYRRVAAIAACLGQNSIGGTPGTEVESVRDKVECNPDCANVPPPCSGNVVRYFDWPPQKRRFATKCLVEEPPPDPSPDPEP